MPISEYLRLAKRYRENMKALEELHGLKAIRKNPEAYLQCLESKIAYHTYKGLYWEGRARLQRSSPWKAERLRDSHYTKRDIILHELSDYRQLHSL